VADAEARDVSLRWNLVVAHRERLLRVAGRRVPNRQDAEDVVHEAMLRCVTFEKLDEERLGQFLTTVTVRLCADVYRAARPALRDQRLGPHAVVAAEEADRTEAQSLSAILARLPDRQRAVLQAWASGLSMSEVARRQGMTYRSVERVFVRARATLRSALSESCSRALVDEMTHPS
jgi:RNA polymerase sigma factor (sigma-70 family)